MAVPGDQLYFCFLPACGVGHTLQEAAQGEAESDEQTRMLASLPEGDWGSLPQWGTSEIWCGHLGIGPRLHVRFGGILGERTWGVPSPSFLGWERSIRVWEGDTGAWHLHCETPKSGVSWRCKEYRCTSGLRRKAVRSPKAG